MSAALRLFALSVMTLEATSEMLSEGDTNQYTTPFQFIFILFKEKEYNIFHTFLILMFRGSVLTLGVS